MSKRSDKIDAAINAVCERAKELATVAAYEAGWRERHAVGIAVEDGSLDAITGDLATPTALGIIELRARIAGL